jgi:hypothetical protein
MKLLQTNVVSFLFTGSIIFIYQYHNCLYKGFAVSGIDWIETPLYVGFNEAKDEIMDMAKEFIKRKALKVS